MERGRHEICLWCGRGEGAEQKSDTRDRNRVRNKVPGQEQFLGDRQRYFCLVSGLAHACIRSVGVRDGLDIDVRNYQMDQAISSDLIALVKVWT